MSKKIKPTKSLIWLLILPLIIGLSILVNNTVGSNTEHIKSNPVAKKRALKKSTNKTKKSVKKKTTTGKKETKKAKENNKKSSEPAANQVTLNTKVSSPKKLNTKVSSPKKSSSALKTSKQIIADKVEVTLSVNKGSGSKKYPTSVEQGSTVLDVLKTASQKYGFSLKYTNYSYGAFIQEIDSLANNPANSMYWLYYINGKKAGVGASSMKIKKGDEILWKYEKT